MGVKIDDFVFVQNIYLRDQEDPRISETCNRDLLMNLTVIDAKPNLAAIKPSKTYF
ncbi:hypothetical protein NBRC116493_14400 [Aurantivibrio infirmus]